jgi:uncharacterized protein involved in exopolysaccharide biosynthesis
MNDDARLLTFDSLVRAVLARRWLFAAVVIAVTALGVVYAIFATKIYRAETLLAPNRDVASELRGDSMLGSLGSIASFSGLLDSGQSITNEALATLRSRAFLQKFIEEEGLLPVLYANDWDPAKRAWKPTVEEVPTVARAWKRFRDKIMRIEEIRGKDLYEVSIEWRDPKLPAIWLEALIRRLNTEMRARQMKEATAVLAFLEKHVQNTDTVEIRAALFRLTESQLRRVALADVRPDYAFRVIDPPFISQPDDFVRPSRVIVIALSLFFGLALALATVLILRPRER